MPQLVCMNCYEKLKSSYEFRSQCLRSYEMLYDIITDEENEAKYSTNFDTKTDIGNVEDPEQNEEENDKKCVMDFDTKADIIEGVMNEDSEKVEIDEDESDFNNGFGSSENGSDEEITNEQKQRSLADILIKKYKIYNLTCNVCYKEISTRSTLLRHMETHDNNRQLKHECETCNKRFYTNENLKKHIKRHLGETKFSCDLCPKKFYVLSALGVHYKSSHKSQPLNCLECSAQFYHPLQLEQHDRNHREKVYICDICGKKFPKKNRLTKHKKYHSLERPFGCPTCQRRFKTKADLTSHIKLRHVETDRREICYICGKMVPVGTLTIHIDIHKDRSVKCPDCDKIFASKIILDRHINHIHINNGIGQKYYCEICSKPLGSKGSLKTHMVITHSADKNNKCHICGKTYKLLSHVTAHINSVHMDVRPHSCEICDKAFHTKLLLKNHMRTHTGERPFPCQICGKAFGFKNVLNTHMKVHSK